MQTITFFEPDRGRPCNGCTQCCTWLSSEAFGFKFGSGLPCTFLKDSGCSIYECRPDGCKAFQCLWKTDIDIPEWLKPNQSNVIMAEERFGNFTYICIVYAGKPDLRVFDWINEQVEKDINFMIWNTREVFSNNKDFKDFMKVISKQYGV
jgi:hypothetical protein